MKTNRCEIRFVCKIDEDESDCRFRKSNYTEMCIHRKHGICTRKEAIEMTTKEFIQKREKREKQ